MLTTVDPEFEKHFGNSLFYLLKKETRQPTFLSRNIKTALNYHQRLLENPTLANATETSNSIRAYWQYPPENMDLIEEFENGHVVEVSIKGLWPNDSLRSSSKVKTSGSKLTVDAKARAKVWKELADAKTFIMHNCRVMLKITCEDPDKGADIPRAERTHNLLTLSHLATVRGKQNIVGQRFVEFEMEPFKVDLQALMAAKGNGVQWKKGLGHKLEARIGISHKDSEKANKLVDFLKPKLPALQSTKFDMATALDAAPLFGRWGGFLSVPYTGQMLPLLRRTGEQMMQFDHQIDLDLSYKRMGKTPLAVYNQSSKRQRTSHLPSPVSETMPPKQVAEVKWRVVKGIASNSTTRADTSCLFCGDTVFPTVARLHHHLKTNHENNKFEVKEKETQRGAEVVNEVTIDFEVSKTSDNARASDSVPDARAVTWVAPKEPFNETEYNAGNEDWVAKGSYEGKRKAHSKTAAKSVIIKPKSPSKIAKLPVANRKKHKVPRGPPGITFFRTLSKRALDEGEYVSESDDDIDITWLKLRRDGETSDSDTPESAKAFIKKIDDYMEDERLTDDLHVGDALVRFANKNREWLQQSWAAKELLRKAAELRSDDIISEAVLQHCIDFVGGIEAASNENSLQPRKVGVHSTPPRTPTTPSPSNSVNGNAGLGSNKSRNRTLGDGGWDVPAQAGSLKPKESKSRGCSASNLRDRDGDIEMTERSPPDSRQPSDDSAAPEKPPYDTCFCGNNPETASRLRDVVWCANDLCIRHCFHLKCADLPKRRDGWKCRDCKGGST